MRKAKSKSKAPMSGGLFDQSAMDLRDERSFPASSLPGDRAESAGMPDNVSIEELRKSARACRACDLWKNATQTVFGEGAAKPTIMFVGEQPGDQEDRAGSPFVGPAGRLLDEALAGAGIDRSEVYVTNAVKHFKWVADERGKRRIHKKPRAEEIRACRPWLEGELKAIRPRVLVALGATAAQALFGRTFSVTRERGELVPSTYAPIALATVHPSSILRAPDEEARREQMAQFVEDLKKAAKLAQRDADQDKAA